MPAPGPIPINTDLPSPIIVELIYRLKIRDIMNSPVHVVEPGATMRCAQQVMKERNVTGLPVVDQDRLVGIVSMDDVIRALDEGSIEELVSDRMTRSVIVLEDDMPLSFAIQYIEKFRFGRFPVLSADKRLVGIVSSRDVIVALLMEINKEIERFEARTSQRDVDHEGFRIEHATRTFDFEMAGKLSTETKQQLKRRGFDSRLIRRVAIATYELEMNQVVHSVGGRVSVTLDATTGRIRIVAEDRGPGIPDVEAALQEGFSTATEWVRSLGFGAGMGLPNARRVADDFDIRSGSSGTTVTVEISMQMEESAQ